MKKKKKKLLMFFSPSKLNVSYFVLFGLQQLSVICLLQTKKKKKRLVVDYRSISTDTILVYVCVKKKKRSTGDMNTVHLL